MPKTSDDTVTAARRAEQNGASNRIKVSVQGKQFFRTISADTGSELVAANDKGFECRETQIPEDLIHVSFTGFFCDGADICRFGAVFRASERGMAGVYVSVHAVHCIRDIRIDRFWDPVSSQSGTSSLQVPFGSEVNG